MNSEKGIKNSSKIRVYTDLTYQDNGRIRRRTTTTKSIGRYLIGVDKNKW